MKRDFKVQPGYDCMHAPCQHTPKGDHGIHGDQWHYSVIRDDGASALSLTVFTTNFPSTVPAHKRFYSDGKTESGSDLSMHTNFPTDRESIQHGSKGQKCEYVAGGRCWSDYSTALGAHEFWDEHATKGRKEQPDSFWLALEARCDELFASANRERADLKWARCKHCDGVGTIARVLP